MLNTRINWSQDNKLSDCGEIMADLPDLLNKAIEKELSSSRMYMWQHLALEKSDIGAVFKENALDKLEQAINIGEHLFKLGDIPDCIPENVGNSLKEMIEFDLKSENEVTNIYQEVIGAASREEDANTRLLFEEILLKEKKRKHLLMCARGRATKKLV